MYTERRQSEDRQKGKYHVAAEAETEMRYLHTKERQGLPAATRARKETRKDFPSSLQREYGPGNTLISDF